MITRFRSLTVVQRPSFWIVSALAVSTLLTGCIQSSSAPRPNGAWIIESIPGEKNPNPSDSPYVPMQLVPAVQGGFWGMTTTTAMLFTKEGLLDETFSEDWIPSNWTRVDVTATSSEQLVSALVLSDGKLQSQIVLRNMRSNSSRVLAEFEGAIGAVASDQGEVTFIAYRADAPGTFDINRLNIGTGLLERITSLNGNGATADLSIRSDGALLVSTDSGLYWLASDGSTVQSEQSQSSDPIVSIAPDGSFVWVRTWKGPLQSTSSVALSQAANEIVSSQTRCDGTRLTVNFASSMVGLDALCSPTGVVWLSDTQFVVSLGDEGNAPLVKVSLPARPASR